METNINRHTTDSSNNGKPGSQGINSELESAKNGRLCVKQGDASDMAPIQNTKTKISNIASILINLLSFLVLIILFVLFKKNAFTPFRRGFFCGDLSIRYPAKEDSVSTTTLVGCSIIIAILVFVIGEYLFNPQQGCHNIKSLKHLNNIVGRIQSCLSKSRCVLQASKFLLIYFWSLLACQVLVNVLKHTVGTLRPNFFIVCNPNVTCSDRENSEGENTVIYHTDYQCQGITPEKEASLRTSFPSGHAAFSATAALFLVTYIQAKMRGHITINCSGSSNTLQSAFVVLLGPTLQFICIVLSCLTSLLRVSDYKHHLLDVIVGYLLGGLIGVVAAYHALGWDSMDKCIQISKNDIKEASAAGYSIQEVVELNESRSQQNDGIRNNEDVEKIMEHETGSNTANVNRTRQNTTVTTESE